MRCAVKEIRIAGRNTQGVRIKKLSGVKKLFQLLKLRIIFNKMKTAVYPGTFDPITMDILM